MTQKELKEILPILHRCRTLVNLVTIRQVFDAGGAAIDASGLNPWCINEGLADGSETIDPIWLWNIINELEAKL